LSASRLNYGEEQSPALLLLWAKEGTGWKIVAWAVEVPWLSLYAGRLPAYPSWLPLPVVLNRADVQHYRSHAAEGARSRYGASKDAPSSHRRGGYV